MLRKANIPFEEIDKLIPIIMQQAENNYVETIAFIEVMFQLRYLNPKNANDMMLCLE